MTQRFRTCVSIVIGLLVMAAAPVLAQERGAISGTVTDSRGTPLRVTVIAARVGAETRRQASSAEDGTFVLGGLVVGAYIVSVEGEGYVPFRQQVTVEADGDHTLDIVLEYTLPDFVPVRDRWRLKFPIWQRYQPGVEGEFPFVKNRGADPYDQNVLKGDLPVFGNDTFFIFTGILETPGEFRSVPTTSGVSADRPGSEEFFGMPRQFGAAVNAVASFELFKGSTAFKPRDWAIRITPQFQFNYARTRERNALDRDPAEGTTRTRHHLALQEAFGELRLATVSPNFDFISVRAGIQPFSSDFRGFLFRDTNLGVRLFGTAFRNRHQWNLGYFDQLEKETNSELNLLHRRHQRVYIANYYIQDFLTPGYTLSPSVHINHDLDTEYVYDANGFLVRPSPVGTIAPHAVRATYVGLGGDGHIGRLNITHQFYQAFGTDEFNGITGGATDINARFGAIELSVDRDWYRVRAGFLFASGDSDPDDDQAEGFDAIMENPNFAGGPFSFWNRQGIRLAQTEVGLVGRFTLLPALRSSKSEGQSNFVNPGLFLYSAGIDAELTPKLRFTTTANYLRFHHVESLQRLLFQDQVNHAIGIDLGAGFQYRPWLNDNVVISAGASSLLPGKGFKDLLTSSRLSTGFVTFTFTY